MAEEASIEFRLRKLDKTRSYILEKLKHNDLTSEKYEKIRKYLTYVEHLFTSVPKFTGCFSVSAFASLVCVPVGITSSALEINICAITAGTTKYTSIVKKRKRSMIQ